MKLFLLAWLLVSLQSVSWAVPTVPIPINPDSQMTPGQRCSQGDMDFSEFRYAERMPYCNRHVNGNRKREVYANYGIPKECKSSYTVDHLIPLSMGGNNSVENLWPEHHLVKETRELLEEETFKEIGEGNLTSEEAAAILLKAKRELILDLSQVDGCG